MGSWARSASEVAEDRQEGVERCWDEFETEVGAAGAKFRFKSVSKSLNALLAVPGDL